MWFGRAGKVPVEDRSHRGSVQAATVASVQKGHALLPLSLGLPYVPPGTAYVGLDPHIWRATLE